MADVNINIKISNGSVADFKAGFLKAKPIDDDFEGSEMEWFKHCIETYIFRIYKTGKMQIAKETTEATIDEEIIEVS